MNKKLVLIGTFCLVCLFTFVHAQFSFAAADQKDAVGDLALVDGGRGFSVVQQQGVPTSTPTTGNSPLPTPINTPIPAPTTLPPTGADLTFLLKKAGGWDDTALTSDILTGVEQEMGNEALPSYLASGSLVYPVRLAAAAIELDTTVKPLGWRQVIEDNTDVSIWEMVSKAAGWHLNSVVPGQVGNAVISGHNNVGSAVFRNLHRLRAGDELTVWNNNGEAFTYTVDTVNIVQEKYASATQRAANAQAISPTTDERLTLITCWPSYSNTHRVIVVAHPTE